MPALAPRQTVGVAPADGDAPPAHDFDTEANIDGDHNGLTNVQIGAMVGAIIGFIIIVLLLICCCLHRRRQRHILHMYQQQQRRTSKRYTVTSVHSHSSSYVEVPSPPKMPRKPPVVKTTTSKSKRRHSAGPPPPPPMPKERIPGGPRYPTYNAIPIPNPRKNPTVRHKF